MDSKVENIVDLGLVNYVRHPTDPNYVVYRFADEKRATDFERELKALKIWYEKGEEEARQKNYILFGVHKRNFERSQRINYAVEASNRNFLIRNRFFRYSLLLISIGTVVLAFIGYCTRPDQLKTKEHIEIDG